MAERAFGSALANPNPGPGPDPDPDPDPHSHPDPKPNHDRDSDLNPDPNQAARSSSSPTTGRRVCSAVALAVVGVARMLFMFYGQAWKGMAALTLTHETQPKPKP